MIDLNRAINALYENQAFSIVDNDYATLAWHESNSEDKPTLEQLELAAKLFEIEDAQKQKLEALIEVVAFDLHQDVEYKGNSYRTSEKALLSLSGNYSLLEDDEKTSWLTSDGKAVELDKKDFKALMLLCRENRSAAYFKEAVKTQEILSLTLDEADKKKDTVDKVVALIEAVDL